MARIVVLDGYVLNPGDLSWDGLSALGDLTVYDRTPANLIIERIGEADAIFTNKTPVSASTLAACPNIQFIGVLATGYNVVDLEAASARNIPVCNVPGYSTASTSQHAIALLLEICNNAGKHSQAVYAGRWENSIDFSFWDYPLIELDSKTMGIIGFGQIGQTSAKIASALGMRVLAYGGSRTGIDGSLAECVDLDTLYRQSDVIMLHCPLNPETEGLINRHSIAKMKDGVILINNGRGPLIVEQDLAEALNSGKVYAAGLDVVSSEPIQSSNPLLKAKNCVITPHISWASFESRKRLMEISVNNLRKFLSGEKENAVNM